MKVINTNEPREKYIETQITRSHNKFNYCKVSINHVFKWRSLLERYNCISGPTICLGTRNGREVDLFRICTGKNLAYRWLVKHMEINRHGYNSLIPKLEGMFRSDINNLIDTSVIGVEINPEAKRKDIFIGSFDDLQEQWANTFAVLYSNSFDQSQDPSRTAREWRRILKPGGIAIVSYSETAPTPTDPVGNLTYKDILTLFPGELLYFEKNGSTYHDVMIRL